MRPIRIDEHENVAPSLRERAPKRLALPASGIKDDADALFAGNLPRSIGRMPVDHENIIGVRPNGVNHLAGSPSSFLVGMTTETLLSGMRSGQLPCRVLFPFRAGAMHVVPSFRRGCGILGTRGIHAHTADWFRQGHRPRDRDRCKFRYKVTLVGTYHCNFRCEMCGIWTKKSAGEMTPAEVESFFGEWSQFSWVHLTGGELFMRRDLEDARHGDYGRDRSLYLLNFPTTGWSGDRTVRLVERILGRGIGRLMTTISIDGPKISTTRCADFPVAGIAASRHSGDCGPSRNETFRSSSG